MTGTCFSTLDDHVRNRRHFRILRNSGRYLTRWSGKAQNGTTKRCRITSYQPILQSNPSTTSTSALFGQPLDVKPAPDASNPDSPGGLPIDMAVYRQFNKNCDQKGGTHFLWSLMKDVTGNAP